MDSEPSCVSFRSAGKSDDQGPGTVASCSFPQFLSDTFSNKIGYLSLMLNEGQGTEFYHRSKQFTKFYEIELTSAEIFFTFGHYHVHNVLLEFLQSSGHKHLLVFYKQL